MQRNELLPELNLVLEGSLGGLSGGDYADAYGRQYNEGGPGFSAGFVFSIPLENNIARARLDRRRLELRQQLDQLTANLLLPPARALDLKAGDPAALLLDDRKRVAGTVEFVSPVTDPASGTVRVKFTIENSTGEHRSGVRCAVAPSRRRVAHAPRVLCSAPSPNTRRQMALAVSVESAASGGGIGEGADSSTRGACATHHPSSRSVERFSQRAMAPWHRLHNVTLCGLRNFTRAISPGKSGSSARRRAVAM